MIKYLLDTNIVIYTMRNRPEAVRRIFNQQADRMAISTITLGELIYGAEKSSRAAQNLAAVEGFAARIEVAPFDDKACAHWGQIRANLAARGETIGPYDAMIAGHARSAGLILVSNNLSEFSRVEGLRLENWAG